MIKVSTVFPKKVIPISGDFIFKLFGEDITTIDKPELANAFKPIPLLVIEFGIAIDVKLEQLSNALLPIVVTILVAVNVTDDNA